MGDDIRKWVALHQAQDPNFDPKQAWDDKPKYFISNYAATEPLLYTTVEKFEEVMMKLDFCRKMHTTYTKTAKTITLNAYGIKILLLSAYNPSLIETFDANAGWLDEPSLYEWRAYKKLRDRVAQRKGRLILTTTPGDFEDRNEKIWLYQKIWKPIMEDFKSVYGTELFNWGTLDNPYFQDREMVENARKTEPEDYFARRYLGVYKRPPEMVYSYTPDKVYLDPDSAPLMYETTIEGTDFGKTTKNPCGLAAIGIDNGKYYWINEFKESGIPIAFKEDLLDYDPLSEDFEDDQMLGLESQLQEATGWTLAKQIKKWDLMYHFARYFGDQEDKDGFKWLRRCGIPMEKSNKRNGSVTARTRFIQGLINQNRFFILSSCRQTITEIEEYKHKKVDGETIDAIDGHNDHLMDGGGYAIHTYGIIAEPEERHVEAEAKKEESFKEFSISNDMYAIARKRQETPMYFKKRNLPRPIEYDTESYLEWCND